MNKYYVIETSGGYYTDDENESSLFVSDINSASHFDSVRSASIIVKGIKEVTQKVKIRRVCDIIREQNLAFDFVINKLKESSNGNIELTCRGSIESSIIRSIKYINDSTISVWQVGPKSSSINYVIEKSKLSKLIIYIAKSLGIN